MPNPDSHIQNLFSQEPTERLIRVATSDPDQWDHMEYGWYDKDPANQCLLGHMFDVDCETAVDKLKDQWGATTGQARSPYRRAEGEYIRAHGLLMCHYPGQEAEYMAARICIHLAWIELRKRNDQAARQFLANVEHQQEAQQEVHYVTH